MTDFLQLAKDRFSVRAFQSKPVEAEKIEKILEAAKVAPTAVNAQPQVIYVMKSQEAMEKINSVSPCIYGAPIAFLICYDFDKTWKNPTKPDCHMGVVDASIVCTHMMLQACELGLGSCWVGRFNPDEVIKTFQLPAGVTPVAILPVGYADEKAEPSPRHSTFRPTDEMVKYL